MDGNMSDNDAKLAEAMRQQEVYEKAMKSLEIRRNRQVVSGITVMSPFVSLTDANKKGSRLARRMGFVQFALVLLLGIFINYIFWSVFLSG